MKPSSWTKAAPYKETPFHRTPSESIANNFSPKAQNLKLKTLSRQRQKKINANSASIVRQYEAVKRRSATPLDHQQDQKRFVNCTALTFNGDFSC